MPCLSKFQGPASATFKGPALVTLQGPAFATLQSLALVGGVPSLSNPPGPCLSNPPRPPQLDFHGLAPSLYKGLHVCGLYAGKGFCADLIEIVGSEGFACLSEREVCGREGDLWARDLSVTFVGSDGSACVVQGQESCGQNIYGLF